MGGPAQHAGFAPKPYLPVSPVSQAAAADPMKVNDPDNSPSPPNVRQGR